LTFDDRAIEPRPAATLVLVRDGAADLEVLLLQRTPRAVFMPGVYVFPGGAVDESDHDPAVRARAPDLDEATLGRAMDLYSGAAAYVVAAIRECFEEAGVLLADPADMELREWRARLAQGDVTFAQMCASLDLRLRARELTYLSRWITPPGLSRRYDTRFFLAPAPAGQAAVHDGEETVDHLWIHPAEALERYRRGELPLGPPTVRTLADFAGFSAAAALFGRTHRRRPPATGQRGPLSATGRDGERLVHPGDPAYAEVAKLNDENLGRGGYEIIPGVPAPLSRRVTRVTAPNPGTMTGPGTNTYLLDCGGVAALIDPGPLLNAHIDAVIAAAGQPVGWILTTHTHPDHSPGTRLAKHRTGATVIGMPPPDSGPQDRGFEPERVPRDGERLELGEVVLRAIHTPGHASNHLCYLLESERLLFSGDHVMQGSTVVISPPDGDMSQYLNSLRALLEEDLAWIAPGHGFLIGDPEHAVRRIIEHRIGRENKVSASIRRLGRAAEDELLAAVYDDVPHALHDVARQSLRAHLIKLRDEGRISHDGEVFAPVTEP